MFNSEAEIPKSFYRETTIEKNQLSTKRRWIYMHSLSSKPFKAPFSIVHAPLMMELARNLKFWIHH